MPSDPHATVGRRCCGHPRCMSIVTAESASLRAAIVAHRDALDGILRRYQAANPRLFGSVARGDATGASDIDLMVDLLPGGRNALLRVAGVAEELSQVMGVRVDVVTESLLRDTVSSSALADAVPLCPDLVRSDSPTFPRPFSVARNTSHTSGPTSSPRWPTTRSCAIWP